MRYLLSSIQKEFPNVSSISDARSPIHVIVSPKDAKVGKSFKPTECALARACKREMKIDGVIINLTSVYLIRGRKAMRYQTTDAIRKEIISFDRSRIFAPGEYVINPPCASQRLGYNDSGKRGSTQNKKRRRFIHKTAFVRRLN